MVYFFLLYGLALGTEDGDTLAWRYKGAQVSGFNMIVVLFGAALFMED